MLREYSDCLRCPTGVHPPSVMNLITRKCSANERWGEEGLGCRGQTDYYGERQGASTKSQKTPLVCGQQGVGWI